MSWRHLREPSGHYGPAVYKLRLVTRDGEPIPIPTLLGGLDASGVVDIGETGNFERRHAGLLSGIEQCNGHSAGNLWRYLCQFTRLQDVYPGCRLEYALFEVQSKLEAEQLEGDLVKEYIIRFGQLPILNRELPRPYDDDGWNRSWESVNGPVPSDWVCRIPVGLDVLNS